MGATLAAFIGGYTVAGQGVGHASGNREGDAHGPLLRQNARGYAGCGQKVKRVTFSASGRKVVDARAPFAARFATKGFPAQILVKAQVRE